MKVKTKIAHLIATGCYSGLSPLAPGTVGSLVFLGMLMLISFLSGEQSQRVLIALTGVITAVGWWAASVTEKLVYNKKDPGAIVIDEWAGMGLSLMLFSFDGSPQAWFIYGLGFVLFRFFDIVKPYPIYRLQSLKGGLGIMADDVLAGTLTLALLWLVTVWAF